jgi:hypothetical protein
MGPGDNGCRRAVAPTVDPETRPPDDRPPHGAPVMPLVLDSPRPTPAPGTRPGRRPLRAAATALAALALVALTVVACGGAAPSGSGVLSLVDPSASPDPSATPAASVDPEDAMLAFQACMKEHGVDVQVNIAGPAGGGSSSGTVKVGEGPKGSGEPQPGGSFDADKMAEADVACRPLLPGGGQIDPNATMDPAMADRMLAFSQCMRDHGITDYPDPTFEGGGVSISIGGAGSDIDPGSATFQAAQSACETELPSGFPAAPGAGAGSGPGTIVVTTP